MSAPIDRLARLHLAGDRRATEELARQATRLGVHPDSLWGCDPGLPPPPPTLTAFVARYRQRLKAAATRLGMRPGKSVAGRYLLGCVKGDLTPTHAVDAEVVMVDCRAKPGLGLPAGSYKIAVRGKEMPIVSLDGVPHIKGETGMVVTIWPDLEPFGAPVTNAQLTTLGKIREELTCVIGGNTAIVPAQYHAGHRPVGPPRHPLYYCRLSWRGRPMSWYCSMKGNERGSTRRCFPHVPHPLCA
jgi:hypothetical protein